MNDRIGYGPVGRRAITSQARMSLMSLSVERLRNRLKSAKPPPSDRAGIGAVGRGLTRYGPAGRGSMRHPETSTRTAVQSSDPRSIQIALAK